MCYSIAAKKRGREMIKICFVDDEPLTIEWLEKTVDWKKLGIEKGGSAPNGEKGMELILKEKPEIVITDVRMPVMDGLLMIEEVQKKDVRPEFIILSGYEEFEYARKAIQFGVQEYLLKPLTNEKLEETMGKIVEKIQKEHYRNKELQRLQEEAVQAKDAMRMQLYKKIILEDWAENDQIEKYRVSWEHDEKTIYQIVLLSQISPDIKKLLYAQMEKVSGGLRDWAVVELQKDECAVVFCCKKANITHNLTEKKIEKFAEQLYKNIEASLGETPRIGISDWAEGVEKIGLCYYQAKNAIEFSYAMEQQSIAKIKDIVLQEEKKIYSQDFEKEFQEVLLGSEQDHLEEVLKKIWKEVCISSRNPLSKLKRICSELVFAGFKILRDLGIHAEEEFEDSYNPIGEIHDADSLEELNGIMMEAGTKMRNCILQKRERTNSRIVQKVFLYVENHLEADISAEALAESLNVSPGYFSTIFKRETGQAFVEYVTEMRMDAAKRYLKNQELKISRISTLVGFKDPKYFTCVFKKVVGMSPQEYRKNEIQKNSTGI